jgi:aminoglycoside phosphotransferase (APT) family kinase protein
VGGRHPYRGRTPRSLASVPPTIAHVDATWVADALGAMVSAVDVEPIAGHLARVHVRYDEADAGPATVVVKLPPTDHAVRARGLASRAYEREARFYRHAAPVAGIRVPWCFRAQLTDDGLAALVLEDLAGERGHAYLDAGAAVDALADLHASWWDSPYLDAMPWMPRADDAASAATLDERYASALASSADWVGRVLGADAVDVCERLVGNVAALVGGGATDDVHTMVHGDVRIDNLLFGLPDGDAVAAVDWQAAARAASGVADLVSFLGSAFDAKGIDAHGPALVTRYQRRLAARGVPPMPAQDWQRHLRLASLTCLAQSLSSGVRADGYVRLAVALEARRLLPT